MFSAILLAAGTSSRMKRLKALLPWGNTTLIEAQITQIALSRIDELIVVTGYERHLLDPLLSEMKSRGKEKVNLKIVYNENYKLGKSFSIRAAAAHISGQSRGAAVIGVDQPVVAQTLDCLLDDLAADDINIPVFQGKKGHPPVFGGGYVAELAGVTEEREGLRQIMRAHANRIRRIEVPHPQVLLNLNQEQDYVRALDQNLHFYNEEGIRGERVGFAYEINLE